MHGCCQQQQQTTSFCVHSRPAYTAAPPCQCHRLEHAVLLPKFSQPRGSAHTSAVTSSGLHHPPFSPGHWLPRCPLMSQMQPRCPAGWWWPARTARQVVRHSLRLCVKNADDTACKATPVPLLAALHRGSCFALQPRPRPTCWLERAADLPGAGAAPGAASIRWPPVLCTEKVDRNEAPWCVCSAAEGSFKPAVEVR